MEWLVVMAFIGTWYLAGKEIERLQVRLNSLEDSNQSLHENVAELKRDLERLQDDC